MFIIVLVINYKNIKLALWVMIWPVVTISLAIPISHKIEECYQLSIAKIYTYKEKNGIYPTSVLSLDLTDFSCTAVSDDTIKVFNLYAINYFKWSINSEQYSLRYSAFNIDDVLESNTITQFD